MKYFGPIFKVRERIQSEPVIHFLGGEGWGVKKLGAIHFFDQIFIVCFTTFSEG